MVGPLPCWFPKEAGAPGAWRPLQGACPGPPGCHVLWLVPFQEATEKPGFGGLVCWAHWLLTGENKAVFEHHSVHLANKSVLGRIWCSGLAKVFPSQTLPKGSPKTRVAIPRASYFLQSCMLLYFCKWFRFSACVIVFPIIDIFRTECDKPHFSCTRALPSLLLQLFPDSSSRQLAQINEWVDGVNGGRGAVWLSSDGLGFWTSVTAAHSREGCLRS